MASKRPVPPATRQSPTPWAWARAGALLGLLMAISFNAPALWFTAPLERSLGGRVLFEDAQGTLWNGSARLLLTGGAGSRDAAALPGRLVWSVRPSLEGLSVDLLADCCMRQAWHMSVQPRWGGARVVLSDALSQWPAQWLTGLGTPWNTVQAEGQLTLLTKGLEVEWAAGRLLLAGRAQLDASKISSRLSTSRCWAAQHRVWRWKRWRAVYNCPAAVDGWARGCGSKDRPAQRLIDWMPCPIF